MTYHYVKKAAILYNKWVEPISFSIYLHKNCPVLFWKFFQNVWLFWLSIIFTGYNMEFRISIVSFFCYLISFCESLWPMGIFAKYSCVIYFWYLLLSKISFQNGNLNNQHKSILNLCVARKYNKLVTLNLSIIHLFLYGKLT